MKMSKDDYYVIAYKLLSYLYSCLKNGDYPINTKNLTHDSYILKISINELYWEYIVRHLYEEGYIDGVDIIDVCSPTLPEVKINSWIEITPSGIDFLNNISNMIKVKELLKDIKEILPWS